MTPVRIVGSYLSPYVRKVLVCLDLKRVPYEIDPIVPFFGNEDFSRLSPIRRIPVLVDDQVALSDSSVIGEYLEERHPAPALLPTGAVARARARWFEEYADTRMGEVFIWKLWNQVAIGPHVWGEKTDPAIVKQALEEEIPQILDYLEGELPDAGFLFGELSLADVALGAFFRAAELARYRVDAARWPKTASFVDRTIALEAFAKLRPFEDLSARTPIPKQREALLAAGAPITAETFGTATPRRGMMKI